eukprot:6491389-Amphidinium_carterae.1
MNRESQKDSQKRTGEMSVATGPAHSKARGVTPPTFATLLDETSPPATQPSAQPYSPAIAIANSAGLQGVPPSAPVAVAPPHLEGIRELLEENRMRITEDIEHRFSRLEKSMDKRVRTLEQHSEQQDERMKKVENIAQQASDQVKQVNDALRRLQQQRRQQTPPQPARGSGQNHPTRLAGEDGEEGDCTLTLGTWPQNTMDEEIIKEATAFLTRLAVYAEVDSLWAPYVEGSIARLRVSSKAKAWKIIRAVSKAQHSFTDGKKAWCNFQETQERRAFRQTVNQCLTAFQAEWTHATDTREAAAAAEGVQAQALEYKTKVCWASGKLYVCGTHVASVNKTTYAVTWVQSGLTKLGFHEPDLERRLE